MINPPPFSLRNETKISQKGLGSGSASPHSLQSPSQRPGLGWNAGYPRVSHPRIRILPCGAAPRPKDPSGKAFWGRKAFSSRPKGMRLDPGAGAWIWNVPSSLSFSPWQPLLAEPNSQEGQGTTIPDYCLGSGKLGKPFPAAPDPGNETWSASCPSSPSRVPMDGARQEFPWKCFLGKPAGQPLEFPLLPCF